MGLFVHSVIFLASVAIIWFFAGKLVESVSRIARRNCTTGFFTAFFVLGFLTSVSEFSVALNSALAGVPGVSAGNLIGASLVILLFIVPLLAVAGRGIRLNEGIPNGVLLLTLAAIILPVLLSLDGNISRTEGLLALLAYGTVAYALYRARTPIQACELQPAGEIDRARSLVIESGRVVLGAIAIFAAAHFLVEQAVYFAMQLHVPNSLMGLLLLSLGTNIPEIVIALRAIGSRKTDIAFGDYLGSAAMNTFIFGFLGLAAGAFSVEASEFVLTGGLFISGTILLYFFARSGRLLTRREGAVLLAFYALFILAQAYTVLRLSGS